MTTTTNDERGALAHAMKQPSDGALARHPKDAFVFAEPWPMSDGLVRIFHGLIRAMCPPEPVVPDMERRIEQQVRRMMRYMHPMVATAFTFALRTLEWSPLWRLGKVKRLSQMSRDEASALMEKLSTSRIGLIGDMVAGARAAVLAPYYDLEEIGRHIGWEPVPFMRERLSAVAKIRAGRPASEHRIGPFSPATQAPLLRVKAGAR